MTISYTGDICSTRYWSFLRVIFRWRGSIWKSVLTELCIWLALYYAVMFTYRALGEEGKKTFVFMAQYTGITADYIPLTFMLGFFVKIVVERWNHMFANIGFVDNVAHLVTTIIRGNDAETTTARRNIMRYLCLIQVLVLRDISVKVRKHFPGMRSVVESGLLQLHEQKLMNGIMTRCGGQYGKYWIPHNWICQLCYRMRENGRIASDPLLNLLLREIRDYRERLQKLVNFDLVPIPLAYPQVVFMAVRTYFLICLFSRQHFQIVEQDKQGGGGGGGDHSSKHELLIPVMTILQFIFYMGWVKVAEALLNPLGEDDDDFETLYVIERNIAISMLLADQCHAQIPEQRRDSLDENNADSIIPQGKTSVHALIGSAVRRMPKGSNRNGETATGNRGGGGGGGGGADSVGWPQWGRRFWWSKGTSSKSAEHLESLKAEAVDGLNFLETQQNIIQH